jgi:hypothetical protein
VLHDRDQEKSVEILKSIVPAMKRGYSKILIGDVLLTPTRGSALQTAMDLQMMGLVLAEERTDMHWRQLIKVSSL